MIDNRSTYLRLSIFLFFNLNEQLHESLWVIRPIQHLALDLKVRDALNSSLSCLMSLGVNLIAPFPRFQPILYLVSIQPSMDADPGQRLMACDIALALEIVLK